MAELVNETFASDVGDFSAGSVVDAEGADFANGYLSIPTATTATSSFTAVSSGNVRVEWWFRVEDTETAGDATKDTTIHILPTAGAVSLANSLFTMVISRDTNFSASTNYVCVRRNSGGTLNTFNAISAELVGRGDWIKFAVVINIDTDTHDLYLNDILWFSGVSNANTSAADISRIAIVTAASAPATSFDNFRVESAWTIPTESVLIEHDFTAETTGQNVNTLTPDTNNRQLYNQPWKTPDDTATLGTFTTTSGEGLAPTASKDSLAMQACRPEGICEIEFKTAASTANAIYVGIMFRVWGGSDGDSNLLFRYWPGSTNDWTLFQGATALSTSATSPALSTNSIVTLKVEMRGRYLYCYAKSAAMDSGSYTLVFTRRADSTGGGRGQLAEEHCGPFVSTAVSGVTTDNYVRKFRFTGRVPDEEETVTIGDNTAVLSGGAVREWYRGDVVATTRNHFWSRGIQAGHRAESDMGNYAIAQATVAAGANCKSFRQRALMIAEDDLAGVADLYWTFSNRGVWVSDSIKAWGARQNFAPDMDLRPELWDPDFVYVTAAGASSSSSDDPFHNWSSLSSSQALPLGYQSLTAPASGDKVRQSQIYKNIAGLTGSNQALTTRLRGVGDPISRAMVRNTLVDWTTYTCARAIYNEVGALSLDGALLAEIRDDVQTPASLTVNTGTLKTDAAGDHDTDGFNDRHGWHEVNAASGAIDITLAVGSSDRHWPQFRIHGWTPTTPPDVTIDASAATAGTDYLWSDFGDGTALLELLSVRTADTDIAVTEGAGGSAIPAISHHYRQLMTA